MGGRYQENIGAPAQKCVPLH